MNRTIAEKADRNGSELGFSTASLCFREGSLRSPQSVKALEDLGRVRLSDSFFMRDFLHSEISQIECIPNVPEYPDIAIEAGRGLCQNVLEPIQGALGRI